MNTARSAAVSDLAADTPRSRGAPRPTGPPQAPQLLGYIEDMLLELAHMAAKGGEPALAASLAITAIQCGSRRREAGSA